MLTVAAANLQNWDLESHKIAYQEAFERRRQQLEKHSKVEIPMKSTRTVEPNEMSRKNKETDFKKTSLVFEGQRKKLPEMEFELDSF